MFLDKNYFTKIVFYKKNLIVKKFLTGEFFWPKMISKKKNCLTENVFDQKLFWPIFFFTCFFDQMYFFQQELYDQILANFFFFSENILSIGLFTTSF